MRKLFLSLLPLCFVTASFASVPVLTPPLNANAVLLPLGKTGNEISLKEFSSMSVSEFQTLAGEKLNFIQRIFFVKAQKKIRKSIAEDGTIKNKKLEAFLNENYAKSGGDKSQLTAALLAFFLGGLGIHRFYLGYTWQGIVQLLTLGGLGIWALIDFIRILTGSLKPKDGEYAKTL